MDPDLFSGAAVFSSLSASREARALGLPSTAPGVHPRPHEIVAGDFAFQGVVNPLFTKKVTVLEAEENLGVLLVLPGATLLNPSGTLEPIPTHRHGREDVDAAQPLIEAPYATLALQTAEDVPPINYTVTPYVVGTVRPLVDRPDGSGAGARVAVAAVAPALPVTHGLETVEVSNESSGFVYVRVSGGHPLISGNRLHAVPPRKTVKFTHSPNGWRADTH